MYFLVEYNDGTIWLLKNISFYDEYSGLHQNDMLYSTSWVLKGQTKYTERRGAWLLHYVKSITPISELPDWAPENWPAVDKRLVIDYVITDKDLRLKFSDRSRLKFERDIL